MSSSRPPNIPGPVRAIRAPKVRFPENATDCHAHIFGPATKYPVPADAHYIPHDTLLEDYVAMLQGIGCGRGVLVQPSVYGTDNSAIVEALESKRFPLRAVAVVAPDVSDRELERLHAAGFRGIRINIVSKNEGLRLEHAAPLAARIKPLGWHLQFYADFARAPEMADVLAKLPVTIVLDHFCRAPAAQGVDSPAFRALLGLLAHEHCWAKMMGAYFVSDRPGFTDTTPLAQEMVRCAPDRLVWGSDWPHPGAREKMPNDGDLADLFATWVPDEAMRRRILVDNPARLYGF